MSSIDTAILKKTITDVMGCGNDLGRRESCTLDNWHVNDVSAYRRGAGRGNVSQGIPLSFQKDKRKRGKNTLNLSRFR